MTSANKTEATNNVQGQLEFDDKVIQKIVGISVESISGLLDIDGGFISNLKNKLVNSTNPTDGVQVEVGQEEAAVDLNIVVEYGKDIRGIYEEIKAVVTKEVEGMTGLKVVEINVRVVDIQTKTEFEKHSVTLQDRVGSAASSAREATSKGIDRVQSSVQNAQEKAGDVAEDVANRVK